MSAPKRKSLTAKVRFEVFKRDRFACQYCGAKAPDVLLRCDHIHPVAEGGTNDILNLITACFGCNAGKGARLLDDRSVMDRQRAQLEDLEARREQLEMMLKWRDQAEKEKIDTVAEIAARVADRGGFEPNENGRNHIRRWLKRYGVEDLLSALDEAFDIHMRFEANGEPDTAAWEQAFKRIPNYVRYQRLAVEKPYMQRLAYTQGILRARLNDRFGKYLDILEQMHLGGVHVDDLDDLAKRSDKWCDFVEAVDAYLEVIAKQ